MTGDLAMAERDLGFPIPLDVLGEFYLAEPGIVLNAIRALPASKRARLVLACRRHPELSGVAAVIADMCGDQSLCDEVASIAGDLAAKCRRSAELGRRTRTSRDRDRTASSSF